MAYDEGLAHQLREDLAGLPMTEQKMFGGLCFLHQGNMVAGIHPKGAMYRVGRAAMDQALALPGVGSMAFTGRPMAGIVEAGDAALSDDAIRTRLAALARAFAESLPPKMAKPRKTR